MILYQNRQILNFNDIVKKKSYSESFTGMAIVVTIIHQWPYAPIFFCAPGSVFSFPGAQNRSQWERSPKSVCINILGTFPSHFCSHWERLSFPRVEVGNDPIFGSPKIIIYVFLPFQAFHHANFHSKNNNTYLMDRLQL